MDLMDAIYTRRSVRGYTDKPVDRGDVQKLIDAAIQAPNAMNTQPWAFAVIQDKAVLADLSNRTRLHLLSLMDKMPMLANYREMLENPDYNVFYGASTLVIICGKPNSGPTPEIDCALAAENLMLAARGMGMGTCWMGFVSMYLMAPEAKREFGLPEDYLVVAPIAVGYPVEEPGRMERNPADMVFWK